MSVVDLGRQDFEATCDGAARLHAVMDLNA